MSPPRDGSQILRLRVAGGMRISACPYLFLCVSAFDQSELRSDASNTSRGQLLAMRCLLLRIFLSREPRFFKKLPTDRRIELEMGWKRFSLKFLLRHWRSAR